MIFQQKPEEASTLTLTQESALVQQLLEVCLFNDPIEQGLILFEYTEMIKEQSNKIGS